MQKYFNSNFYRIRYKRICKVVMLGSDLYLLAAFINLLYIRLLYRFHRQNFAK